MKKSTKKAIAIMSAMTLLAGSVSATAESAIDTIMNVGTTQAFTEEAVSADDLQTILNAGLAAESAINQQPWYLVAVTDKETMEKISGSGAPMGMPAGAPDGASFPGAPEGGEAPAGAPEGGEAPAGAPEGGMPAAAPSGMGAKAALGDTPAAIIVYMDENTKSPDASFDCGLATQNMYIAAASLGYGVKIVSSPTMTLNGDSHDELCELLGVDPAMKAVAVLLIGYADDSADAVSSATTRGTAEEKTSVIE